VWARVLVLPSEFQPSSPLEAMDPEARLASLYDTWVQDRVFRGCFDLPFKFYYTVFVSDNHSHGTRPYGLVTPSPRGDDAGLPRGFS
jgi:hypothetical protein